MNSNHPIGTFMQGGHFTGVINIHGEHFGIITAPKSAELGPAVWHEQYTDILGARSFFDGLANTQAMAAAGSDIAKRVLALSVNDHADWYIPSRDEAELQYRHFKPGSGENYVYRNGDNPSSIPAGYPYTADHPAQTGHTPFLINGAEAFAEEWYWTSTQVGARSAWARSFTSGSQNWSLKSGQLRVRPVRRFKLNS